MKHKLSVSVEKEVIEKAKILLKEGKFRNMSHIVEYALRLFLKGESNELASASSEAD